jgi:hypothetical protein
MTYAVVISGSRSIKTLPQDAIDSLAKIIRIYYVIHSLLANRESNLCGMPLLESRGERNAHP